MPQEISYSPSSFNISKGLRAQLFYLLIIATTLQLFGCRVRNFVVNPNTVCRCGEAGIDDPCFGASEYWQDVVNNQLEVSAWDFTNGSYIGTECQGEVFLAWEWPPVWFNSWRPVDGIKHTLMAELHHFNWNYDDDEDWNLHMLPDNPYRFLITDVEAAHSESIDDHRKCGSSTKCMEGEISPDKAMWVNPWFFSPGSDPRDTDENGYSWLEGRKIGMYGPWIMDANHDFKAEIHPIEMMWWKDHWERGFGSERPFDIFWLALLQDNTGRFDDRDNFDCDGSAPSGWEPWMQSPRSGQFNIAFEVDPNGPALNFYIYEITKRFVVTSSDANAYPDCDDGKDHALKYNGKILVKVFEEQPNDNDLGVKFTNICLRPDGKLQGFVSIRSKVGGDDDKDEEGYHIFYVVRNQDAATITVPRPTISLEGIRVTSNEVPNSIKRDPGGFFAGDFIVHFRNIDTTVSKNYSISKVQLVGADTQREIIFEQKNQSNDILLKEVPMIPGTRLRVTTTRPDTVMHELHGIAIKPLIKDTIVTSAPDPGALQFLARAVDTNFKVSSSANIQLSKIEEIHFRLLPRHVPLRKNEIMTDRESKFISEINGSLIGNNQKKLTDLFGTDQPFKISWSIEGQNLNTGEKVSPNTPGIRVENLTGTFINDSLKITLSEQKTPGIIEFNIKCSVTDYFGKTSDVEYKFWSYYISTNNKDINNNLALIEGFPGLKEKLSNSQIPARDEKKERIEDPGPKVRNGNIIKRYLQEALRNRQITIDELRNISSLNKTLY